MSDNVVTIRHCGDVPLRRLGKVPPRHCWEFHLRRYLRRPWDVQRDVSTTFPHRPVAGWVCFNKI